MNRKKIIGIGILCGLSLGGSTTIHAGAGVQYPAKEGLPRNPLSLANDPFVGINNEGMLAECKKILSLVNDLFGGINNEGMSAAWKEILGQAEKLAGENPTFKVVLGAVICVISGKVKGERRLSQEELELCGEEFLNGFNAIWGQLCFVQLEWPR
jgi:hypothetical protein